MQNVIETIKNENRRASAADTEKLLFDLYETVLGSQDWGSVPLVKQANIFNEIRELIELKRKLEALKPELANELATNAN